MGLFYGLNPLLLRVKTKMPGPSARLDMSSIVALRFLSVVPNASRAHELRQREVLTALNRTAAHPAFGAVHLLVRSLEEAHAMFGAFSFILPQHVTLTELGRWPLNSDLVEIASTTFRGRTVLASNDDVYPEGDAWLTPPEGALLLSRHAKSAETCDGCGGACDAREGTPWWSQCLERNSGNFDGWVHRFAEPVTNVTQPAAFALLATPRHAFGADNLLGHTFEAHLGVPLTNRCHRYRLFHLHCRLPTSFQFTARLSGSRRGYGEGRRKVPGHGDMARLLLRHDPQHHTWEDAKAIVRRRWPPVWEKAELGGACGDVGCGSRGPAGDESLLTRVEMEEVRRRDPKECQRGLRQVCAPWAMRRLP